MNIENKKQIAILALAIGSGLVATTLVGTYIQQQIQKERELIQKATKKQIEPLYAQMQAMTNHIKDLEEQQALMAQQGTQVAKPSAEAAGTLKSSLSLRTPAGRRAYTVMIDSLSAVGGMINPGDYVDIMANMNIPNPVTGQGDSVSSMVFQNIQILAVGTNLQSPGSYDAQQSARSLNITFALTPQEAGLMSFLERNGKMQLILRAPAETEILPMQVSAWSTLADYVYEKQGTELLTKPKLKEEQGKEEVKPFIQIFQGGREM